MLNTFVVHSIALSACNNNVESLFHNAEADIVTQLNLSKPLITGTFNSKLSTKPAIYQQKQVFEGLKVAV